MAIDAVGAPKPMLQRTSELKERSKLMRNSWKKSELINDEPHSR